MKKAIKRNAVHDLIKIGVYTKKDIAKQLGITVGSVSVHMTHLRWQGHLIIYDLDSRVLRMTTKAGYTEWLGEKIKTPLTPEEIIAKLDAALQRICRSQAKWRAKATKVGLSADDCIEIEAQLVLLNIRMRRIETALWEVEMQQHPQNTNSTSEVGVT